MPVESTDAPARVFVADQALLDSVDLARRALLDVTPAETVGSVAGHLVEDEHVLTLLFAADLPGYPGWHWSVTIARVDDGEPTVLETELMPGETALLAPEWVPWSERMADYRAAQEAAAAAGAAEGEAGDEEDLGGEDDEIDEDVVDDEMRRRDRRRRRRSRPRRRGRARRSLRARRRRRRVRRDRHRRPRRLRRR